jgi:hypothetical protein
MHKEMERGFLGLASKPRSTISLSLASKSVGSGFLVWASKAVATVGDLGIKITATIFWFGPQTQANYGLSVVPQNR